MFALFHLGPKLKCYTRSLAPSANCCTGLVLSWCLFCDDWWASTHFLSTGQMIQPEISWPLIIMLHSLKLTSWRLQISELSLTNSKCSLGIMACQELSYQTMVHSKILLILPSLQETGFSTCDLHVLQPLSCNRKVERAVKICTSITKKATLWRFNPHLAYQNPTIHLVMLGPLWLQ